MWSRPRAAPEPVVLARRLGGGLVVAPDDVAPRAGMDRVVSVAAEELVMAVAPRHHPPVNPAAADDPPVALAALVDRVAGVAPVAAAERVAAGARVERAAAVGLVHQQD